MRVIVDKIDGPPRHALSKGDIREIVKEIPADWRAILRCVHISSSRSAAAPILYDASEMRLTVAARGIGWEGALQCFLIELAAHVLGFKGRTFHRLQARHRAQVERLVGPIYEVLYPVLAESRRCGVRSLAQPGYSSERADSIQVSGRVSRPARP